MNRLIFFLLIPLAMQVRGQESRADYPYQPVPFSAVTIDDAFWKPRQEINHKVTIPFAFGKCESTGRIENFKVAARVNHGEISTGTFCSSYGYDDSDVFKIIEGAAYALATTADTTLEAYLDTLISNIAAAQEPDGYLYSMRTIDSAKSWARERWVNDRTRSSHELYNVGHMYEAAVAYYQATGKRNLLDVAIRNADLLCATFGPGKLHTAPGHQEIEIGLAKLYRVTGNRQYLELARFFLDERGKGEEKGGEYNQDHKPVTSQDEAVGHAVRAVYMYSAMADIAALTGDTGYIHAIDRMWENVTGKKIYITGGIGANGAWEAFGRNWELPNLTAYNETCAAIASVFWNYRMFLLHGETKYIDVLERTLYNGLISGVSLDGTTFFYPNPLESTGDYARSEWFGCSCCPSNITRFVSSVSQYIYAQRQDTLFVNLFIAGKGHLKIKGKKVEVTQATRYPWDGAVTIFINPDLSGKFAVNIRIPGWATEEPLPGGLYNYTEPSYPKPVITLNGTPVKATMKKGYAVINRVWKKGDRIELILPMPVRRVMASDSVTDDFRKVCLVRGPIVYCAEGIDHDGTTNDFIIPDSSNFITQFDTGLLNGVMTLTGKVLKLNGDGYLQKVFKVPANLRLIPYYAWCHRGPGAMNVWFYDQQYVFAPLMKPASSLFLKDIEVEFKRFQDQEIRFTTDSMPVSRYSEEYDGFVAMTGSTTLRARAFGLNGGESAEVIGHYTKTLSRPAAPIPEPIPGIHYSYYPGKVKKLPDFSTLVPGSMGELADVDILTPRDTINYYSLVFSGFIKIPVEGVYTFTLVSDDGSRLWIDGESVADNDGVHGEQTMQGQIALQSGYHKFLLSYFQYNGAEKMEVLVEGPGLGKQKLPASWLFR